MPQPRHLEVTYRNGKLMAAYLYLPRQTGDACRQTVVGHDGLVTDISADGRALGIEITAPSRFSLASLNAALLAVNEPPVTPAEVAPLLVARSQNAVATAGESPLRI